MSISRSTQKAAKTPCPITKTSEDPSPRACTFPAMFLNQAWILSCGASLKSSEKAICYPPWTTMPLLHQWVHLAWQVSSTAHSSVRWLIAFLPSCLYSRSQHYEARQQREHFQLSPSMGSLCPQLKCAVYLEIVSQLVLMSNQKKWQ